MERIGGRNGGICITGQTGVGSFICLLEVPGHTHLPFVDWTLANFFVHRVVPCRCLVLRSLHFLLRYTFSRVVT